MIKKPFGFAIFLLFLFSFSAAQSSFQSVQTGNWDDASTWQQGAGAGGTEGIDYPAPTDNVFISSGDTVYLDYGTTGTLYEFEGYLEVDTGAIFWVTVGTNSTGLALINNARIYNRGQLYTARANEGPGTVGPVEIDIYLEDNSIYYAFTSSYNYCADDIHIRDNAIFYVEVNVCVEIDDDIHLRGTNSILCGDGGASIGTSTANNNVIYENGAGTNNLCTGLTVFRGPGGTCNPTTGTAIATGTGPTNLRPRAVDDNFSVASSGNTNLNVLFFGLDDIDIDGSSLEIIQAGSNAAINDLISANGGTLSINDNGTPVNTNDDYIVYTPLASFVGIDNFQYVIEDVDGATDTGFVMMRVACGERFITTNNYTYATYESDQNNVINDTEAEGSPDGNFAEIYNDNQQLILDFGQVFTAGTQYEITWRRRNSVGTGTAIIDLSESTLAGSGFTNHPNSPTNNNNVSFTTTTVTSNVDFRYLAFDKGNSSSVDYEIDAVGVISSASCTADQDSDGVADDLDTDDDNDGILDVNERICEFVGTVDAYWSMDNSTDDVSGNNYDAGSGTTTPAFSTDAIQGSHSASFNGTSQQIRYSVDGDFMESQYTTVSFSAWIKPDDLTGTRVIYEEGGTVNGLILWLNGNALTFSARSGGAGSQTNLIYSQTLTVDNQWHHVACTFDNGLMTLYFDGVGETLTASFTDIPAHSSDGGVGGSFSAGDNSAGVSGNYSGLLDAARYSFSEAWSAARIALESDPSCDSDGDGLPNIFDLDSDNDGIADIIEAGGLDSDGNGTVDVFVDSDNDGWADTFDPDDGGTVLVDADTDGDGFSNRLDIDSDNDGIVDNIEGQATNSAPSSPLGVDTDGDGIDDAFDIDQAGNFLTLVNTDGTDEPDYLDIDSDNDGFTDFIEAYDTNNDKIADVTISGVDDDVDGLDDVFDNVNGSNPSTNVTNNGQSSDDFPNADQPSTPERDWREILDTDEDGVSDFFDIDNDNDGILDADEAICETPVVNFGGSVDAFWSMDNNTNDVSGNGRNSGSGTTAPTFSTNDVVQGTHAALFNGTNQQVRYSVDGGFMEDDYTEVSFSAWIKPNNLSGTRIIYEEGAGTNGLTMWLNGNLLSYSARNASNQIDLVHTQTVVLDQWQHVACTFDNGLMSLYLDGVLETLSAPYTSIPPHGSDGGVGGSFGGTSANVTGNYSGLLDAARYSFTEAWPSNRIALESQKFCDSDGDGVYDRYDLDADNDGIPDILEAGGLDGNGDGRVDGFIDSDGDGWADEFDPDNGGSPLADDDLDGDAIPNRLDLDADNDGLIDNVEAQLTASFIVPSGSDGDGDGWDNAYDSDNGGTAISLSDNDSDGNSDFLDFDTDGDGLEDWIEGFDDNASGDALDDFVIRADNFESAAGNPLFYVNTDDADADNIPDWLEDDDADGLPNFLDSDNALYFDSDRDGIVDLYDTDNFGIASNLPDFDGDGEYDFRDTDDLISLPIELLDFSAKKQGNKVLLEWSTTSELNNNYFTIERSLEGHVFNDIGRVAGAGNSSELRLYNLIDESPENGYNYYRLKQTDFDGTVNTHNIEVVKFDGEEFLPSISLFPNPNDGNEVWLNASGLNEGRYQIQIRATNGQILVNQIVNISSEENLIETQLYLSKKLPKGVYMVQFFSTHFNKCIKLIVN